MGEKSRLLFVVRFTLLETWLFVGCENIKPYDDGVVFFGSALR